jgi:hypothetical protein
MMDLISFPDNARVWVFQANQPIADDLIAETQQRVSEFVENWTSHNRDLKSTGGILHNRFVVLVVDENRAGASGCSIDKAMHFVQALGRHLNVDFLDRNRYTIIDKDELKTVSAAELQQMHQAEQVSEATMVYDNLVSNKADFIKKWVVPIGESWVKRVVFR